MRSNKVYCLFVMPTNPIIMAHSRASYIVYLYVFIPVYNYDCGCCFDILQPQFYITLQCNYYYPIKKHWMQLNISNWIKKNENNTLMNKLNGFLIAKRCSSKSIQWTNQETIKSLSFSFTCMSYSKEFEWNSFRNNC